MSEILAKDCETMADWLEWCTDDRIVTMTHNMLLEKEPKVTREEVINTVMAIPDHHEKGRQLLASWMMKEPHMAERFEKLESLPKGTKLTMEELAKLIDEPLESLEWSSIKAGLFTDNEKGELKPTQKALDEGMIQIVDRQEQIVSCYCNQIKRIAEILTEAEHDPEAGITPENIGSAFMILADFKENRQHLHFGTKLNDDGIVDILVKTIDLARVDVINVIATQDFDWFDKQGHRVLIKPEMADVLMTERNRYR